MSITGREAEEKILFDLLASKRSEFLAIYGRRRIGKTFLIREFFKNKKVVFFNSTGEKDGPLKEQIEHFTQEIGRVFYHGVALKPGKNWEETFDLLTKSINALPKNKKIILFFDEFPWMATPKSRLLQNLDYYWNQHWSQKLHIKLIICGSSASWLVDNIINHKGGLHNRITRQIRLEPFNLQATQQFLIKQDIRLTAKQTLKLYMVAGGVPYYLMHIPKGLSAMQAIEQLAFTKQSLLLKEFDNLFASLFTNYELSVEIIRLIAQQPYGLSQEALFSKLDKKVKGKLGLTKLKELEEAGFIQQFKPHFHERRGIYYKLIDEYTLFYLKWIEPVRETLLKKQLTRGYWERQQTSPAWYSWSGLAFESICYKHLAQISLALGLSPAAIPNTWRYTPQRGSAEKGAQIDLLFDREDDAITICEIKYTDLPFVLDKQQMEKLNQKVAVFKKITKTSKQLFLSLISANGIKKTIYSEEYLNGVVVLDDLFKKIE